MQGSQQIQGAESMRMRKFCKSRIWQGAHQNVTEYRPFMRQHRVFEPHPSLCAKKWDMLIAPRKSPMSHRGGCSALRLTAGVKPLSTECAATRLRSARTASLLAAFNHGSGATAFAQKYAATRQSSPQNGRLTGPCGQPRTTVPPLACTSST